MKTHDFINNNIGATVYVNHYGDLAFDGNLKGIILNQTPLVLVKLTRSGFAYLHDVIKNKYYTVPPRNVRLYSEVEDKKLLEIYMWGFNDELSGIIENTQPTQIKQRAYNLGRSDAIIGDDVRSVDYQTNDEILTRIKKNLVV